MKDQKTLHHNEEKVPMTLFDHANIEGKPAPTESDEENGKLPLANVFAITHCIYCESKNIVKRGKRKKKYEEVQLFYCNDCHRTFTGQTLKGKQFPARMVLDGVSYYNVGFSLEQSSRYLELSYGLKVDSRTLSKWIEEFKDLCRYARMREYGLKLYSPHKIVESSKMCHRQTYHFRYHRAKMQLVLEDFKHYKFSVLKEFLDLVVADCPHQLFKNARRASEVKNVFSMDQVRISEKKNFAVRLAGLVLQAVTDNKKRHDTLQKFMLANDSVTVATEIPVYLDKEDIGHFQKELKFDVPIEIEDYITGHIDILQVRNGAIHILDYKPNAKKKNPIEQLTLYALMLSRLTGLRLYQFKCAWFDHEVYYEFFPLHVVYKKKKQSRIKKNSFRQGKQGTK
ncbi:MAG: PD-(D/E)XK nuclease family protein [bacterium]